jgi:hypothetical protein
MHSIQAEIKVEVLGSGGKEYGYPVLEITYSYTPGCRARVNYDENDYPAESAEVEVMDVTLIEDGGLDPIASQLMQWAEDYIQGDGYYRACEEAEADYGD